MNRGDVRKKNLGTAVKFEVQYCNYSKDITVLKSIKDHGNLAERQISLFLNFAIN